jgi:serpin B
MKRIIYVITVIILLFAVFGCAKNKEVATEIQKEDVAPDKSKIEVLDVATQNNHLAFELFKQVDNAGGENIVFSPYSINSALAMAYTGAAGNTAYEIASVMGYPTEAMELGEQFEKSLNNMKELSNRKNARLDIANALFDSDQNLKRLLPTYSKYLQHFYGSELHGLDFSKPAEAAGTINKWVEKNTESRIKNIVQPDQIARKGDGLILVNTIYFKSPWRAPFLESNTKPMRFYIDTNGKEEKYIVTSMMQQKERYAYLSQDGLQILEMPFEEQELSMIFILPENMDRFAPELTLKNYESWMSELDKRQMVQVYVPRFKLEESLDDLTREFKALGVKDAFAADKADFSGIYQPGGARIYISDFVHKAFLEVSEEGAEAAAATQIGFAKTSLDVQDQEIPVFKLDRPFYSFIVHKPTQEILFLAKIMQPEVFEN